MKKLNSLASDRAFKSGLFPARVGLLASSILQCHLQAPPPMVRVRAERHVVAIHAAGLHTCADFSDGHSLCWGLQQIDYDRDALHLGSLRALRARPDYLGEGPVEVDDMSICSPTFCINSFDHLGPPVTLTRRIEAEGWDECKLSQFGAAAHCVSASDDAMLSRGGEHHWDFRGNIIRAVRVGRLGCALERNGQVMCFGDYFNDESPIHVVSYDVVQMARQDDGIVVRTRSQAVKRIQLVGDGNEMNVGLVTTLEPRDQLSIGAAHLCVLRAGQVWCRGDNTFGQLGPTSVPQSTEWVRVPQLEHVVSVASGDTHTCALTRARRVVCWGDESLERLRSASSIETATRVAGLPTQVVQAVAGVDFTCAIFLGGQIRCWGRTTRGSVGIGPRAIPYPTAMVDRVSLERSTPHAQIVFEFPEAQRLISRDDTTCALSRDQAFCWGGVGWENLYRPAGTRWSESRDTTIVLRPRPVDYERALRLTPLACPRMRTQRPDIVAADSDDCREHCGLLSDLGLYCVRREPTHVTAESNFRVLSSARNFVGISVSRTHGCAWTNDGDLWCWGSNRYQQLGTGIVPEARTPRVMDLR